jgi:hypothetical protein
MMRLLLIAEQRNSDAALSQLVALIASKGISAQLVADEMRPLQDEIILSEPGTPLLLVNNPIQSRLFSLSGSMKLINAEHNNFAGEIDMYFSIVVFLTPIPTKQGFWVKRWEANLMGATTKKNFTGITHGIMVTATEMTLLDMLIEYCQVIYGVEWLRTMDVAPPGRQVHGQEYLILVGIYEGARRFLHDVEVAGTVYPAFAPADDPNRATALAVMRDASYALGLLLESTPATMPAHQVQQLNQRYSKHSLRLERAEYGLAATANWKWQISSAPTSPATLLPGNAIDLTTFEPKRLAQSMTEMAFALSLRPCASCHAYTTERSACRAFGPNAVPPQTQRTPPTPYGVVCACRQCGAERMLLSWTIDNPEVGFDGYDIVGERPSNIIEPHEFIAELDRLMPLISQSPSELHSKALDDAIDQLERAMICANELRKFIVPGRTRLAFIEYTAYGIKHRDTHRPRYERDSIASLFPALKTLYDKYLAEIPRILAEIPRILAEKTSD